MGSVIELKIKKFELYYIKWIIMFDIFYEKIASVLR